MIVIVQDRAEWPSKTYSFSDEKQGNMFASMCRRDGSYRVERIARKSHEADRAFKEAL